MKRSLQKPGLQKQLTDEDLVIYEYKNKYRQTAEQIYTLIGGSANYTNPWNCLTRFRVNIDNKLKVDLDEIKKLNLVKGINWNGSQLQIIIGGEVIKVLDEFKKYEVELEKKVQETANVNFKTKQNQNVKLNTELTIRKKILATISAIIAPAITVLMAAGLLGALQAILIQTGVIVEPVDGKLSNVSQVDIFSGIMFIMAKTITYSLGLFFIYNTVKQLGGNPLLGIGVAMILLSRGLVRTDDSGVAWESAQAGDWINHNGREGWLLFKLDEFPIVLGNYESSILPFIAGGVLLYFLDKWIKVWMPSTIDMIFRPVLVILITTMSLWFIFGPVFGLLEFAIGQAVIWFGNIPFGFGVAIFAALWQPLVLTGMHLPIAMISIFNPLSGEAAVPSLLFSGIAIGTFSQVGAGLGVLIKTKNSNLKITALGGITAGIFGITEPIIFGVNLPRVKPFLMGVCAAGIGGLFSGLFGLDAELPGTTAGFFAVLNYTKNNNFSVLVEQGLVITSWVITIGTAFGLTLFFYHEKLDEYKTVKKAVNKLFKTIYTGREIQLQNKNDFDMIFDQYFLKIKQSKKDYQDYLKILSINSKYEQQLVRLEDQESKKREQLFRKLTSLKTKIEKELKAQKEPNTNLVLKFENLKKKYGEYNLENQKDSLHQKILSYQAKNESHINQLKQMNDTLYLDLVNETCKFKTKDNNNVLQQINNLYFNGINAVEISFEIIDRKAVSFRKKWWKLNVKSEVK